MIPRLVYMHGGGPLHGQLVIVPEGAREWRVAEPPDYMRSLLRGGEMPSDTPVRTGVYKPSHDKHAWLWRGWR